MGDSRYYETFLMITSALPDLKEDFTYFAFGLLLPLTF